MNWQRFVYTLVFYALLPLLFLHLLWRGRRNPAYFRRWPERMGFVAMSVEREVKPVICLHAVSVGEAMAARPLVERLLKVFPEHQLWLTSTTPTGSDTVHRLFGERVLHSYLPYDTPGAVQRFLKRVQPRILLIMETEIWPNLFAACSKQHIPVLLLNARLSSRSLHRYQKFAALTAKTLQTVSMVMARTQRDAGHFRQLGADTTIIKVAGDIKFDVHITDTIRLQSEQLRPQWGQRPVWCAGSTHEGEEVQLLRVHARLRELFPDLLLILVPRHPERFDAVSELCQRQGETVIRRSHQIPVQADTTVLLGDSMGELLLWYAVSDVAFVGGSLVSVGGHNPLEALSFATPVLSGRYIHNFTDMYSVLKACGAVELIDSGAGLVDHLQRWLTDHDARRAAGQAGQQLLTENRGVTDKLVKTVRGFLDDG